MNKNAIKKFAIDARNKLIASVTDKAGMLGITPDNCSEAITKGSDFEVYKTAAGTEVTLNKKQCEQRRKLVDQIHARGFEAVVEEVAYTWFNRICAIRFMEVNDYMYPVRVRVLSSEKEGKNEPDVVTMAPDIEWNITDKEREEIIDAKLNNRLDDLFRMLFIKQCNLLHEVLPGLFEETEDYTEMLLNISFTNEDDVIRMLVDGIDEKDFNITSVDEDGKAAGQVEIIGWLYQYYNTEPKNKAFAKKAKITKEEIPAVTQLFTPDWIVRYMVENSLGRMWVEGHPDDELKSKWKYYLDEAEQEEPVQHELDKIKEGYATLKPEDIKLIDPCMGSGHILVYAFDVFMQIYENAGWSQRDSAQSIIQNNIYGLDIDDRAAQLSYFAVLMKARQYDRRILTRGIEPNVYAVQESNGINRGQLKYFGAGLTDEEKNAAVLQMEGLLNTLNDAKEYGSLLNVEDYDWVLLEKFIDKTDTESQISFDTYGLDETAEQLKQLIKIGKVMAQKYEVVVTNPPYAGMNKLNTKIGDFMNDNYKDYRSDLFAAFVIRASEMTIGCYRLETQMMPGNGKLTCTGIGSGKEPKEATNTAFNYLKANGKSISGNISTTTKDYIINYQDMQGIGMTGSLALPTLIAISSAALSKPPISSLAVLGEISIGGTLIKVEDLASTLQVCLDSGAKKVLLPITSAADLGTVPSDLVGAFSLIFYSSPEEAVYKALGVE